MRQLLPIAIKVHTCYNKTNQHHIMYYILWWVRTSDWPTQVDNMALSPSLYCYKLLCNESIPFHHNYLLAAKCHVLRHVISNILKLFFQYCLPYVWMV